MTFRNQQMKWQLSKTLIHFSLSLLFAYAFYTRYWKYRDCIDAAKSSCVTENGDNLVSAGAFWVVPCVIFLLLGFYSCFKLHQLKNK